MLTINKILSKFSNARLSSPRPYLRRGPATGAHTIRKSGILVSGMAALGLLTVVVASAGQAANSENGVPHPTNGDCTLLAWQADVA